MEICWRHLGREGGENLEDHPGTDTDTWFRIYKPPHLEAVEAVWKGTTVFHEQPDP